MTLEEMVGQQLMIGIPGTEASPAVIKQFKDVYAGALIIFRPNFYSAAQFKKLISDLENALDRNLLIAVDHEGGRVIHIAEGASVFPDNLAFGRAGSITHVEEQGRIESGELRNLGFDVNLAPTLDVLTETFSPNIGIRSYGQDPDLVSKLGSARIKSMQEGGLSACAKHFPGQGHSSIDAHLGLPVLLGTWEEMQATHLKPFKAAIEAGVDTIMSSHPVYPELDSPKVSATFSHPIIHDLLREKLGFKGVVLSDDLEMGALRNICDIGEAACRAVLAGHDIVLICHDLEAQRSAFQRLLDGYRSGKLNVKNLEESVERIQNLKRKRNKRFASHSVLPEAGKKLSLEVVRKAVEMYGTSGFENLSTANSKLIIFPKLSSLADRIFIEKECLDEEKFIKNIFRSPSINQGVLNVEIVDFDPEESQIQKLRNLSKQSDVIFFFCFDAHLYPKSRRLLECLQDSAKRLVIILLRDPYDREFVRAGSLCVTAFGFRAMQIRAVLERIFQSQPTHAPQHI